MSANIEGPGSGATDEEEDEEEQNGQNRQDESGRRRTTPGVDRRDMDSSGAGAEESDPTGGSDPTVSDTKSDTGQTETRTTPGESPEPQPDSQKEQSQTSQGAGAQAAAGIAAGARGVKSTAEGGLRIADTVEQQKQKARERADRVATGIASAAKGVKSTGGGRITVSPTQQESGEAEQSRIDQAADTISDALRGPATIAGRASPVSALERATVGEGAVTEFTTSASRAQAETLNIPGAVAQTRDLATGASRVFKETTATGGVEVGGGTIPITGFVHEPESSQETGEAAAAGAQDVAIAAAQNPARAAGTVTGAVVGGAVVGTGALRGGQRSVRGIRNLEDSSFVADKRAQTGGSRKPRTRTKREGKEVQLEIQKTKEGKVDLSEVDMDHLSKSSQQELLEEAFTSQAKQSQKAADELSAQQRAEQRLPAKEEFATGEAFEKELARAIADEKLPAQSEFASVAARQRELEQMASRVRGDLDVDTRTTAADLEETTAATAATAGVGTQQEAEVTVDPGDTEEAAVVAVGDQDMGQTEAVIQETGETVGVSVGTQQATETATEVETGVTETTATQQTVGQTAVTVQDLTTTQVMDSTATQTTTLMRSGRGGRLATPDLLSSDPTGGGSRRSIRPFERRFESEVAEPEEVLGDGPGGIDAAGDTDDLL